MCPFCSLHQPVIRENEHAFVLISDPRKTEGHTLVIPKRHVEKPWEIADAELLGIFELIRFVQEKLVASIAQGCDVRQHYGPFVPEGRTKVNHVHYHVVPRNPQDAIYERGDRHESVLYADLPEDEFERVKKLFG